ncbi:hypothetical protein, partial [Sphingobacterium shayense]|uniref:hypothetical protein n=1 Tax=Sphingobacterium shayense TaxID=626343 RepID=UPI001C12E53E
LPATLMSLLLLLAIPPASGQNIKRQTDKHIVNQHERMVFKSWDRKKFTPKKGFLGLNYQYWLTWAWHPNYPKTDRRPLRPGGPQTLRMGLVLAMQQTEKSYKLQSDTIKKNAVSEAASRAGLLSPADPLWKLYYGRMFSDLLDSMAKDPLAGLEQPVKLRLKQLGSLEWYTQQRAEFKERLDGMRAADIERGNRILGYHHLLMDYRKLLTQWKRKIAHTKKYLKIREGWDISRDKPAAHPVFTAPKSDIEIVDEVLKNNQYP